MRLIDADELKTLYDDAEFVGEKWHVPIRVILANIDDMPTVNSIKHGKWIDKGEYAVCTECGGHSGTQHDGLEPIALTSRFCPNCGAQMILDEVEE